MAGTRRWNIAVCGRRWGKTELGENRLIEAALPGRPVAYFGPTYRMVAEVWRDLVRILRPVTRQIYVQDRRIELVTGGVVEFWSLDTPDVARGRKYARVVIDEAAMVPDLEDAWQAVIRPTLVDLSGDAWFLSTPKGFNFFHQLYQRGQDPDLPDYASWQMPSWANPYLPRGEIEATRQETPANIFRQEYEASFTDDASTIYSPAWWDGQNRYDWHALVHTTLYEGRYLSWDTAFSTKDTAAYSACVVGEMVSRDQRGDEFKLHVREAYRDRLTFPALIDESTRLIDRYNVDGKLTAILIEAAASGSSLVQTLASAMPQYAHMIRGVPVKGDKAQRANQASVWCREGCVLLPEPCPETPWLREFEAELYAAPFGRFMDQADAFAQLVWWAEPYLQDGLRMRRGPVAA